MFFFFKQKTAYEMRISDWSSDVCFSDLKIVNHYSFYAAFSSEEEFRIVSGSKTLGTLPVTQALIVGQRILFAGKTWRVESIDDEQKAIYVIRARGGVPPMFAGGGGRVHTRVRQRMRELLRSEEPTSELQSLMRISYAVFCL